MIIPTVHHDHIPGYVANEHIDWTGASVDLTTTGLGTFGELQVDTLNFNGRTITNSSGFLILQSPAGINLVFTGIVGSLTLSAAELLLSGDPGADASSGTAGVGTPFNMILRDGGIGSNDASGGKGGSGTFNAGDGGNATSGANGIGGGWDFICGAQGAGGGTPTQDGSFTITVVGDGMIDFTGPLTVSGILAVAGNTDLNGTLDVVGLVALTSGDSANDAVQIRGFAEGGGSRAGVLEWYHNNDTISGYTFGQGPIAGNVPLFVWKDSKSNSPTDTGNAWVNFKTGAASWAQGKFVTEADGDTYWVGAGTGLVFGSMYNNNISTTLTITDTTPVRISSGFTAGQTNNTTFGNSREITVNKAGKYKIDWSISFNTAGGSGQDIEGGIGIDNVFNAQGTAHRFLGTATDIGNIAGTAILDLAVNKVVSLMMINNSDSQNIIVTHASLSIVQLGG